MSTYLQLCQDAATESGTVPNIGASPSSVEGQTGRLLKITNWVRTAYEQIQRENQWRWLNADFAGDTIANVREYNSAAMGITERFSRWIFDTPDAQSMFSVYLKASGRSDEGFLTFVDWNYFRQNVLVGGAASATGKPIYLTVDEQNRIQIYPIPDAVYTIRGRYRKSPQILTGNTDVPEMPDEFHSAIVWKALMLLGQHDEAFEQQPHWAVNLAQVMQTLREHQLPYWSLDKSFA
jgi:hypothetical protein